MQSCYRTSVWWMAHSMTWRIVLRGMPSAAEELTSRLCSYLTLHLGQAHQMHISIITRCQPINSWPLYRAENLMNVLECLSWIRPQRSGLPLHSVSPLNNHTIRKKSMHGRWNISIVDYELNKRPGLQDRASVLWHISICQALICAGESPLLAESFWSECQVWLGRV